MSIPRKHFLCRGDMIIYREEKSLARPCEYLARICAALGEFERNGYSGHHCIVEVLIELGEFETGVMDSVFHTEDGVSPTGILFRDAGILAGRLFRRSWEGRNQGDMGEIVNQLHAELERLGSWPLPCSFRVGMPEGYVYYGLFPETYLAAAERFLQETEARRAVCIGLRNIGTSLSSVVGAVLGDAGCELHSFTVRPRGHPFNRHLSLSRDFEHRLAALSGAYALVVDEGPGLSGSSFGCTARKLSELGYPDERIVIFPSWEPEHLGFASSSSREHWNRHPKYSGNFDTVCLESGRLFGVSSSEFVDLSAGKWRDLFYSDPLDYPAVFPQHERRKYLTHNGFCRKHLGWKADIGPAASSVGNALYSGCLLKFAGLGRYGRETRRLAETLADAGFSPPVVGLENGFLITRFLPGKPLSGQERQRGFLDTAVSYMAFLKHVFPSGPATSFEQIFEMVRENVFESMGEHWISHLDRLKSLYAWVDPDHATAVDGRMFPHEWIEAGEIFLKTDGANHFNDHFFPGRQDIAWDLVGTFIEFRLDLQEREFLVERYIALTGDREIIGRLPFYRVVYLAYRLGYATEAADALHATPDGRRFRAMADRYGSLLRTEIAYMSDTRSGGNFPVVTGVQEPEAAAVSF